MVYGIFTFCETFFGFVLAFVPYFEWVKLGFFIWLMHPQFNGATIIYNTVLKPYLADHKEQIEELIQRTMSAGESAKQQAAALAKENLTTENLLKGNEFINKATAEKPVM
jgi:hypothetical protein